MSLLKQYKLYLHINSTTEVLIEFNTLLNSSSLQWKLIKVDLGANACVRFLFQFERSFRSA